MLSHHGYREFCGHLAIACPAGNGPVPVTEDSQANLSGIDDFIEANGHTVGGHVLQTAAEVADGVGRPGLGRNGQHTGFQLLELLTAQAGVCLVKGQMAVDADSAEADVHAPQLFNQRGNVVQMIGVGEHPVILRDIQLRIDFGIDCTVHKPAKAQRMILGDPLQIIPKILVHIDEPTVFQADSLGIHHVHKERILADGAHRTDKYSSLPFFILLLDEVGHFPGNGFENGGLVSHYLHGNPGIGEQLLLIVIVVLVMHSVLPSFLRKQGDALASPLVYF